MLDLEPIKARAAAATPGPWYVHNPDDDYCMNALVITTSPIEPEMGTNEYTNDHESVVAITLYQTPRIVCHEAGLWHEDAEFMAAARQDVPDLVAEIEQLRAALHALVDEPDACHDNEYSQCSLCYESSSWDRKRDAMIYPHTPQCPVSIARELIKI